MDVNVKNFLNIRYSIKNLSDSEFETILPELASQLENVDFIIQYTDEKLKTDWKKLCEWKSNDDYINSTSRVGMKLCEHFFPNFYEIENNKGKSFSNLWTKDNLEKILRWNRKSHSTPYLSELRRGIYFCCGMTKSTMFRPQMSKLLCMKYQPKIVLDPCAGWGGRMLGSLAAAPDTHYCGFEPDTNTCDGLMNILSDEAIPSNVTNRAEIWNEPVEQMLPTIQEKYDLVLTSPPYFNLELYTSGSQSTQSFPTWNEWADKWLKPVILGCLACLKENGTSCWSVKNFQSDKKYPLADITKKIHEEAGWKLVKTVKMTGSGRMGGKRIEEGSATRQSEEETFCFQKNASG